MQQALQNEACGILHHNTSLSSVLSAFNITLNPKTYAGLVDIPLFDVRSGKSLSGLCKKKHEQTVGLPSLHKVSQAPPG